MKTLSDFINKLQELSKEQNIKFIHYTINGYCQLYFHSEHKSCGFALTLTQLKQYKNNEMFYEYHYNRILHLLEHEYEINLK